MSILGRFTGAAAAATTTLTGVSAWEGEEVSLCTSGGGGVSDGGASSRRDVAYDLGFFWRGDDDGQGVEDGPGKDYGENGCCQCGNVIFSPFLAQGFYCFFCGFYMKAHACMITCLPHMLSNMRITRVTCR